MAITLPQPLIEFLSIIGITWPDINEDHVKELGEHVHEFVDTLQDIDGRVKATVDQMVDAYHGASSDAFSGAFTALSDTLVNPMLELARTLGDATPVVAGVIIAMKVAAIVQLVVMAVEFLLDQAMAPITFGLSELAAVAIEELAAQALKALEKALEDTIISQIIDAALDPLSEKMDDAVRNMTFAALNKGMDVALGSSVTLDPDRVESLADEFSGYADETAAAGAKFVTSMQNLTFSDA